MSASKPPCEHELSRLVSYLSGHNTREHATLLWCPRCGALGLRSYDAVVKDRWQVPDPRLPVLQTVSPNPADAQRRREKALKAAQKAKPPG